MKLKFFVFTLIALSLTGCSLFKKKPDPSPTPKPAINEPVNVIDVSQRPYINLTPRNDGREVTLTLHNLPKPATEMEYELEYQAGTLLQGAFGSVDLSSPNFPLDTKILLGSCSAGGACSYHEDVQGGTLILKFRAEANYALKDEWRYQPTADADGAFSSRDSKFQLETEDLDNSNYVIIMQTSGLPESIDGTLLAGPYGLSASSGLPSDGVGELSLRLSEDLNTATIYGYNGSEWIAFDTAVEEKVATAQVDLLGVYIAY